MSKSCKKIFFGPEVAPAGQRRTEMSLKEQWGSLVSKNGWRCGGEGSEESCPPISYFVILLHCGEKGIVIFAIYGSNQKNISGA